MPNAQHADRKLKMKKDEIVQILLSLVQKIEKMDQMTLDKHINLNSEVKLKNYLKLRYWPNLLPSFTELKTTDIYIEI